MGGSGGPLPPTPPASFTGAGVVSPLRVRWLGRVPYDEALAVQRALFEHGREQHLLLLEHPPVYTLGVRASTDNVLVDPADVGAELVRTDRGGDVTYHGPGQLVGYPVLSLPPKRGSGSGLADTVAYVHTVEQVLIDALADLGLPGTGRLRASPVSGSIPRATIRARSPRSASGSAGAGPCTGSPSTSRPTCRCSATSSRAASWARR